MCGKCRSLPLLASTLTRRNRHHTFKAIEEVLPYSCPARPPKICPGCVKQSIYTYRRHVISPQDAQAVCLWRTLHSSSR